MISLQNRIQCMKQWEKRNFVYVSMVKMKYIVCEYGLNVYESMGSQVLCEHGKIAIQCIRLLVLVNRNSKSMA